MTQEVKPITRGALELRKLLEEQGSLAKEEARAWLAEQDPELTPSSINFVIGHGEGPHRNWWHENSEGFLVKGPKPGAKATEGPAQVPAALSDDIRKPALVDPGTMSEPRDQFYTIALNLGIAEKAARTTAFSCWGTAEMYNPAEAWQAIVQSPEIMPSQKKRLWRNWCSWSGIKIPEALAEKVEKQYTVLGSTDSSKGPAVAHPASRRFIPVKGEVVMVEPDDPDGMSFSQALQLADRQPEALGRRPATGQNETGVVVALIHESGETQRANMANQRALLEFMKPSDSGSQITLIMDRLDNQRRENDLRLEKIESDRKKDAELAQQREDHRWELAQGREDLRQKEMRDLLDRLTNPPNQRKGPFDAIEEIAPGFIKEMVNNFLHPPRQENAFRVTIGDQEGNMSLDDYERYSEIQCKREVVAMVRRSLPEFLQMGKDFALATERASRRGREEEPVADQVVSRRDKSYNGYCVECLRVVKLPENVEEFTCPYLDCGALQTVAGEVMATGSGDQVVEDGKQELTAQPEVQTEREDTLGQATVRTAVPSGGETDTVLAEKVPVG
jgi:hypothetical protein